MNDWKKKYREMLLSSKDSTQFENAIIYKNLHLPKKIYKYCKVTEHNLTNLENNQIYLNSPIEFNDPFDCAMCINWYENRKNLFIENKDKYLQNIDIKAKSEILERINNGEDPEEVMINVLSSSKDALKNQQFLECINELQKNYIDEISNKFQSEKTLLSCFSDDYKNILMWSHYADNHKGFCVEYDISDRDLQYDDFMRMLHPVIYAENFLNINYSQIQLKYVVGFCLVLQKFIDWQYENEYRLIMNSKEERLFNMPMMPSNVYLGLKMEAYYKRIIIDIFKHHKINPIVMTKDSLSYNLSGKQNLSKSR